MYNPKRSAFTADKDYYATDAGEIVNGEHPLRRKLVAIQGQNVHEVYAKEYDLPRDYDDVPHPTDPEPVVATLENVDYTAIIAQQVAEQVGKAVAEALAAQTAAKSK